MYSKWCVWRRISFSEHPHSIVSHQPVMLFPATGALFGEKTLKVAANLFSWPNLDQSTSMNQVDIQFERRGHPAAFVDWNPMSLKTVHTQFLSGNPGECDSGQAQRHCATQGKSFAARWESVCLHYNKKNRWKQVILLTNSSRRNFWNRVDSTFDQISSIGLCCIRINQYICIFYGGFLFFVDIYSL